MKTVKKILDKAISQERTTLSEYESKQILSAYKIPVTRELLANNESDLIVAAKEIGYPLVLKGSAFHVIHKTEQKLVRVDIRNDDEARIAFRDIMASLNGDGAAVLVQEMVKGQRELVIGMTRDHQFGPSVMFGIGGIFTEILDDVAFRVAPLSRRDAFEMMKEIRCQRILGSIRGMEAADLNQLSETIINVGQIGMEHEIIKEIDINPVIISGNKGIAVDASVVLETISVRNKPYGVTGLSNN